VLSIGSLYNLPFTAKFNSGTTLQIENVPLKFSKIEFTIQGKTFLKNVGANDQMKTTLHHLSQLKV
jgi:hypothetical protein